MKIIPLTLKQANEFIINFHRHHKPVVGHRFSIGCEIKNNLVGVAIVGRPVARGCDPYKVAEVTRLCTDGTKNVCSFLYSACARISKEMGFHKIQTYILAEEPGTSLVASGWSFEIETKHDKPWKHTSGSRRSDQPFGIKKRYGKIFT